MPRSPRATMMPSLASRISSNLPEGVGRERGSMEQGHKNSEAQEVLLHSWTQQPFTGKAVRDLTLGVQR